MAGRDSRPNANTDLGSALDTALNADWDFAATGPLIDLSPPDDHSHILTQSPSSPTRRLVEATSVFDTTPFQTWYDPPRRRSEAVVSRSNDEDYEPPHVRTTSNEVAAPSITGDDEDPMNQSYRLREQRPVNITRSQDPSPFEVRRHFLSNVPSTTPGFSLDFRQLDYVQPFDQNLLCPICQCPFVAPVRLSCDHIFCMECIGSALEHQYGRAPNCPSCRQKARVVDIEVVPKLIQNMLDDMVVRCPLASIGCSATITRGAIEDHVSKYCDYYDVECPGSGCSRRVPRRWAKDGQCHHGLVLCENCQDHFMEYSISEHQASSCAAQQASCPDCHVELLQAEISTHRSSCPESRVTCSAATYGCTFSSTVDQLGTHQATCPILMMSPFLEVQKAQLKEHETALKQLQNQNSMYRASIANMQDILGLDNSSDSNTFSGTSNSGGHLLALHETLREEVNRVSNAIGALDAKTSMMILNEAIRHKDDMAHANGALSNVRMQVQWLMSSRHPSQITNRGRMAVDRSQAPEVAGPSVPRETNVTNSSSSGGAGASGQPGRSLSDTTRQDPKL